MAVVLVFVIHHAPDLARDLFLPVDRYRGDRCSSAGWEIGVPIPVVLAFVVARVGTGRFLAFAFLSLHPASGLPGHLLAEASRNDAPEEALRPVSIHRADSSLSGDQAV